MDNSTDKKQVDYDYWIYITLSGEMDRPISRKDWADVVDFEPGMAFTDDENTALAVWNDQGVEYRRDFHYEDGVIASGFVYFDNPVFDPNITVAGIRKMLAIADRLGAKVIDEEDIEYHANGEMNTGLRWDEIPFRYKRCQIKLSPAIQVDDTSDMLRIIVTRQDSTYIGGLIFIVAWTLLSYPLVYFGWIPFPHAWLLVVLCPLIAVCLGLTILLTQFRCELSSAGLRAFYRGVIQRGKGEFQLDEIERFEAVIRQKKRQRPEYRVDVVLQTKTLNMFYQLSSESDMSGIVALFNERLALLKERVRKGNS